MSDGRNFSDSIPPWVDARLAQRGFGERFYGKVTLHFEHGTVIRVATEGYDTEQGVGARNDRTIPLHKGNGR